MVEGFDVDEEISVLLRACQDRFGYERARLIGTAAYYAEHAHRDQERKTGGPYIQHPIRVAQRLVNLDDSHVDVTTICTALLHDAVEDTKVTKEQIDKQFGRDVGSLVAAATHPMDIEDKDERDRAHVEKLKHAEKHDPRVVLIKIMDQLDNMRTIEALKPKRREQKAQLMHDYYIQAARRLEHPELADQLEERVSDYVEE